MRSLRFLILVLALFISLFGFGQLKKPHRRHGKGLKIPFGWHKGPGVRFISPELSPGEVLPPKFNLADKWGFLPEVRDQGSSGSCWAHATTESNRIAQFWLTGEDVNLSVQEILSCSKAGTSQGGYFNAHDYQVDHGDAEESFFPYTGRDLRCKKGIFAHDQFKLKNWAYIGASNRSPTVSEIKIAIHSGVAVPAVVFVDDNFEAYKSGIFNQCNSQGTPNHMVTLVGWDDSKGVWILRNSWSKAWGENGYMEIPYGCSSVGDVATLITVGN